MYTTLSKEFEWGNNKENMEDKGVTALVEVQHSRLMKRLLRSVANELLEQDAGKFEDVDLMLDGYGSFLKYSTRMRATAMKENKHL